MEDRATINHNTKLDRNLKICRYRFSNIFSGELRRVEGKIAYTYTKLGKIFGIHKSAVLRICERREYWLDQLKKLSKEYPTNG